MNKIYTLGESSMTWRNDVETLINSKTEKSISYIHPPKYDLSQEEYFKWFISKIRNCDVVVLNLNNMDDKTKFEIVAINTINLIDNKHIFVVGYGEQKDCPMFIKDSLFHSEKTLEDVADYIITYILI